MRSFRPVVHWLFLLSKFNYGRFTKPKQTSVRCTVLKKLMLDSLWTTHMTSLKVYNNCVHNWTTYFLASVRYHEKSCQFDRVFSYKYFASERIKKAVLNSELIYDQSIYKGHLVYTVPVHRAQMAYTWHATENEQVNKNVICWWRWIDGPSRRFICLATWKSWNLQILR